MTGLSLSKSVHFHRGKDPRFRTIPSSQPTCRGGRHGDPNATTVQGPTWHRQHLRQLRRLQTLVCLSAAFERNPNSVMNYGIKLPLHPVCWDFPSG